jgi:hypothetical protein
MEGSLVAYKVFTNGSTLQASELNENLMQQATAVFSNAAARTAAITSPVEGQLTYLEDTNQYASWNGSAWVSPFGLTHLVTQTIGTAVASVVVNNVFSSIYDNYKVILNTSTSSGGNAFRMTLNNSTGSTYSWAGNVQLYTAGNTFQTASGQSSFSVGITGASNTNNFIIEVFNPFLTLATTVKSQFACLTDGGQYHGADSNAASQTGFTLFGVSPTMTGGTVSVYGYRKS